MIQRWQNLLLLISAVMMGLFSFCSLGQIQGADLTLDYKALRMSVEPDGATYMWTLQVFVISLLAALLSVVGLFRYKALKVQKRLCWLSALMTVAAPVCAWITAQWAEVPGAQPIGWSSIALAPFIALVALLLAIRCIGADQRRLSSYNRLR